MMVEMRARIEAIDVGKVAEKTGLRWDRPEDLYLLHLPAPMTRQLELLFGQISFESSAEGKRVTPAWYIKQLVAGSMLREVASSFETLLDASIKFYEGHSGAAASERAPYELQIASRGLEFASKALTGLHEIEKLAQGLSTWRVEGSIKWPEPDWEVHRSRIHDFAATMQARYSSAIPRLAGMNPTPGLPDYFGRAVHISGNECFPSLVGNNTQLFEQTISLYFVGILRMFDQLRQESAEWEPTSAILISSQPILDLLELSGYALLFSELHSDATVWSICRGMWESYLDGPRREERLKFLATIVAFTRGQFLTTHRGVLRTRWRMIADHELGEIQRFELFSGFLLEFPSDFSVDHKSALVRVVAHFDQFLGASYYDGTDIFVEMFLSQYPGSAGLDFGRLRDLSSRVKEEVEIRRRILRLTSTNPEWKVK